MLAHRGLGQGQNVHYPPANAAIGFKEVRNNPNADGMPECPAYPGKGRVFEQRIA